MKGRVAGLVVCLMVLGSCGSGAGDEPRASNGTDKASSTTVSDDSSTNSEQLARRLDAAGLCDTVGPLTGDLARQGADFGMTGAWECVGPEPTNGGFGGTATITWMAANTADKDRALQRAMAAYADLCSGPGGMGGSASSDSNTTTTYSVPPSASTTYVEGPDWVAFAGANADPNAVAKALGGHAVSKHCGG